MNSKQIVNQMFANDSFSQWLGISIDHADKGTAILSMTVTKDMLNGFGVAHGGITYSLADSTLAFAANTHGKYALSIETAISHTKAVKLGDRITATAIEESLSNRLAIYKIAITNQTKETVALFKGTVYRKDTEWT